MTIDEADSFLQYATGPTWAAWYPASANHLLNTLLERLSWTIFGFNQVAMRLPALLGASIYLLSVVSICVRLDSGIFALVVYVCLALNPFVLDYLVAARGYSLAVGFLLAATAVFWGACTRGLASAHVSLQSYALVSALLALSFASNFSFAIADILAGSIFVIVIAISEELGRRQEGVRGLSLKRAALIAACGTLPGLVIVFVLCSSVLIRWRWGLLVYGADSMHKMWKSLFEGSFPPPNPEIVNEILYPFWSSIASALCTVTLILLVIHLCALVFIPKMRRATKHHATALIAAALFSITILTIVLHWVAFRALGLLLPEARTGLFFAPLLTLTFAAAIDVLQHQAGLLHRGLPGKAALSLCALYFLTCLRLHYFQEWRFNEDSKAVYWVLRDIEKRCGIHNFVTEWHYVSTLNFYRRKYGDYTIEPFSAVFKDSFSTGKPSYVFYYPDGESLVKRDGLAVWYHNLHTGATVAVRACPEKRADTGDESGSVR